jgi:hypothetical protein
MFFENRIGRAKHAPKNHAIIYPAAQEGSGEAAKPRQPEISGQ